MSDFTIFSSIEAYSCRQDLLKSFNIDFAFDLDFCFVFKTKEDKKKAIQILTDAGDL